ncbi:MAG: tRNA glutamyl-Q(34) synthetase GluQRS [Acidobacteria bacterium]|nr:MAG: tRNA glutamyl-Q(34) synthetase GluQRS [Acidobacteriota bacterium]
MPAFIETSANASAKRADFRIMRAMISRFAPAPTGFLHLGHVVNAIYVWGNARRILLRIEDHDRQRSRPEFEAAIVADLDWLGFTWDGPIVRQSARSDIYSQSLDRLRRSGLVYACNCSRAEIAADVARPFQGRAGGPERPAPPYPGTCRDRGVIEGPGVGIRVRLEPSVERFVDLRHRLQEQRPHEQCGDLLVRDREGNWTYQFAATVDDFEQGVTLVVRGDDLLPSTGRQIQLARLLGRTEPPSFLHHLLIMKRPGQKLSKSDHDTGVRDLRAQGWSAPRVIGQAAYLAGLIPEPRDLRADDVSSIMAP